MSQQIHRLEDALASCNRCGLCHGVSPLLEVQKLESSTARGKIKLARCLVQGELEASGTLVDRIYECLMCGHCSNVCPAGIRVEEIMHSTRRRLASSGKLPKAVRSLVSNIELNGNIYGKSIEDQDLRRSELVYFPGCVSSLRYRRIVDATMRCISRVGLKASILEGVCCGAPAWAAGFAETYDQISERLKSILEGREVVTGCPQCYYFLKCNRIQVQHVTQLYAELLHSQRVRFPKPMESTVTYSDPCYLARFTNIVDEPRSLIAAIPKLRLVEMRSNRKNTRCCGNGLELVQTSYPELAGEVAFGRLGEALEVGARTVVTSCPHCYLTLKSTARDRGLRIAVKDLSQLLSEAHQLKSPAT